MIRSRPLGYTCPALQDSEPTFGDGRYIVRRVLGRGTMGVVYEAEDTVLARTVAVKTIDLTFAAGEKVRTDFERRFFTEARVAAQLSHPGIVVCHDVGKDATSGKLFIVFEHLKGRTLEEHAAEGPMEWRDALAVVVQVARAIHHAHEHGVVHRDLKPANIMLLDRGAGEAAATHAEATVKIMDFGVARLESLGPRITRTGQAFGSPLYMSPEQALGQPSTARSDIFSLGSVLCTLLLGRPWFEAPSLPKIVDRLAHDDPPRLSRLRSGVPPSLDLVVAKALAKREDDRYRSASEMADDLEDVLAGRAARHAFGPASSSPGGASDEEGLLAGLTGAVGERRGLTTHDPLASLLDESPVPTAVSRAGAIAATSTTPIAGAATIVTTGSRRRWLVPAGALLGFAALAAGAYVFLRRSAVVEPAPPPSVAVVASEPPASLAQSEPAPPDPTTSTARRRSNPSPRNFRRPHARFRPWPLPPCWPDRTHGSVARRRPGRTSGGTGHRIAAGGRADAAEEAAAAPAIVPGGSRIRLTSQHPFDERPPDRLGRRRARARGEAPGVEFQEDRGLQSPRGPRREDAGRLTGPARGARGGDLEPGPHHAHEGGRRRRGRDRPAGGSGGPHVQGPEPRLEPPRERLTDRAGARLERGSRGTHKRAL